MWNNYKNFRRAIPFLRIYEHKNLSKWRKLIGKKCMYDPWLRVISTTTPWIYVNGKYLKINPTWTRWSKNTCQTIHLKYEYFVNIFVFILYLSLGNEKTFTENNSVLKKSFSDHFVASFSGIPTYYMTCTTHRLTLNKIKRYDELAHGKWKISIVFFPMRISICSQLLKCGVEASFKFISNIVKLEKPKREISTKRL